MKENVLVCLLLTVCSGIVLCRSVPYCTIVTDDQHDRAGKHFLILQLPDLNKIFLVTDVY